MNTFCRILTPLSVVGCLTIVPNTAHASETVARTETESYYLAVIGKYQERVDQLEVDVVYWQAAHDRVAATAVERTTSTPPWSRPNERLHYRVGSLRAKVQALREALREERDR